MNYNNPSELNETMDEQDIDYYQIFNHHAGLFDLWANTALGRHAIILLLKDAFHNPGKTIECMAEGVTMVYN